MPYIIKPITNKLNSTLNSFNAPITSCPRSSIISSAALSPKRVPSENLIIAIANPIPKMMPLTHL